RAVILPRLKLPPDQDFLFSIIRILLFDHTVRSLRDGRSCHNAHRRPFFHLLIRDMSRRHLINDAEFLWMFSVCSPDIRASHRVTVQRRTGKRRLISPGSDILRQYPAFRLPQGDCFLLLDFFHLGKHDLYRLRKRYSFHSSRLSSPSLLCTPANFFPFLRKAEPHTPKYD